MSRLEWDKIGEHFFETGVDHVVLYPFDKKAKAYNRGVAWNGASSISESPSGAEANAVWADNIKYLNLISTEEFAATVEAFTYPDEFAELDGSAEIAPGATIGQQKRGTFGLSYRTKVGNDTDGQDYGYKLHIIYGATASPSEKQYQTTNDSPEAATMSWELNTTPISVEGFKPTATLCIDSTKTDSTKLKDLEDILYGTDGVISYVAVTPEEGDNPSKKGWYEKDGDTYTLSVDTVVDSQKTYYEVTQTGGTVARLPLPDEIMKKLAAG